MDKPAEHKAISSKRFYSPLQAIVLVICLYLLGQVCAILFTIFFIGTGVPTVTEQVVRAVFIAAALIGALWWLLQRRNLSRHDIGLGRFKLRDIGYALIGFGIYFLAAAAISRLAEALFPSFDATARQAIGFEGAHGGQLVLVFIALGILPPLFEELICRGFLYSHLRRKMTIALATIITSLLFAWPHLLGGRSDELLWIAGIDTFALSLVLVYLREETDSLWASILLHSLKNTIAFLYLFVFAKNVV